MSTIKNHLEVTQNGITKRYRLIYNDITRNLSVETNEEDSEDLENADNNEESNS